MVAKATYDPALEKQLAEEKKKAREERTKFRLVLDNLRIKDNNLVVEGKLTPIGSTQSNALFKTMNDWLASNPDATADEINDKNQELVDKLSNIYIEDKNRLYFSSVLKNLDIVLTQLKTNNAISEETFKKSKVIIDREVKWGEKNPNESMLIYKQHIDKATQEIQTILGDQDAIKKLKAGEEAVKEVDNTKEIEEKKRQADEIARKKEELEKQEFKPGRLAAKVGTSIFAAFWIGLALSLAFLGGALASNQAIARPLPYRILYFIYGFIFFPIVILYYLVRYFQGHPPYFASFLIPLYEYDNSSPEKASFLERLVYFKENPIIREAKKTFSDAAEKIKNTGMDFQAVAKEIIAEQAK